MNDVEVIRNAIRSVFDWDGTQPVTFSDDTNLLELGLDSISMVELLSMIGSECNAPLRMTDLFEEPTVNGIARAVATARRG